MSPRTVGRPMRLQLAVDAPEHLALVPRLARYFDLVEVGTPLLKRFGLSAVATLAELSGGRDVVVDTKTVDGGELEARMAFQAGASMITVLAQAASATTRAARAVAAEFDGVVVLDTVLGGADADGLVPEESSSAVWLGLHSASDARRAGHVDDSHIRCAAARREEGFRVVLAGGIGRDNLAAVLDAAPDVVVVGSAVTTAHDPEEEALWIRTATDRA